MTWGLILNGGIVLGSLVGFLISREFKLVFPRRPQQYLQVVIGGIMMGYGAALASGCSVGGFFTAVPSLGANGILFGVMMAAGSFAGIKVVSRLN